MTVPEQKENKQKRYLNDFHDYSGGQVPDKETCDFIKTVFGRCCDCGYRFDCIIYFMGRLGITKDDLLKATANTFYKCDQRCNWTVKLPPPKI